VLTKNGGMLPLDNILDFPDRFAGDIPDSFKMLRNEQHPLGIDVPIFDEATGLFRATARIALVDEAALVIP
jgi:hypothetical protein